MSMPGELKDRVAALEQDGWVFSESFDSSKCRHYCRVFAERGGYHGPYRNDRFQWIGTGSFGESWWYVVKEVEKIKAAKEANCYTI